MCAVTSVRCIRNDISKILKILLACCDRLHHQVPWYLANYSVQSLKFLVASICDLPDVINCQFREFAAAPSEPVHFLTPDQQSGIHCPIIYAMQLLTPNNLVFAGHSKL